MDVIDFKLTHGIEFCPRRWLGEKALAGIPAGTLPYFKKRFGDSAERIYGVLTTGKLVQGYQDFSQKPFYRFIFPQDRRKDLAWSSPELVDVRRRATEWLLYRVRKERSPDLIDPAMHLIQKSAEAFRATKVKYQADIFECFDPALFDMLRPRLSAKGGNAEFVASILLASILLEPDQFAALRDMFNKKLLRLRRTYHKYSIYMKRYSRQGLSREATDLVNLGVEFGFLKEPDDFFAYQAYEWPLEYKGLPYLRGEPCISYDLIRMLAEGKAIDFGVLETLGRNPPTVYITSYWEKEMSIFRRKAGFAAGKIMDELVSLLMGDAFLERPEAEVLLRGGKHYYRDVRGSYVLMLKSQRAFYVALVRLGLKPFKLNREEAHKAYGRAEINTGYGITGTPYIVRYIVQVNSAATSNLIARSHAARSPVLNLVSSVHFGAKNPRVTPELVRKCLKDLARKNILIACELVKLIDA